MKAPKLPTVFKQNQARGFGFQPRYYDESKERLDKIRAKYRLQAEQEQKAGSRRPEMEEHFRREWREKRQRAVNSSNRLLLAIVAVLLMVAYFIITY